MPMNFLTGSLLLLIAIALGGASNAEAAARKVHVASGMLPNLPEVDVSSPDRFLNDLMLSPYWKVERKPDGSFVAKARSVGRNTLAEGDRSFLFEFMAKPSPVLPKECLIYNGILVGGSKFTCLQVAVVFETPNMPGVTFGESQKNVEMPVYDSQQAAIGLNSESYLAIKLSTRHEIYVILSENGADPNRTTTFATVLTAMQEIADLAASPEEYRAEERWAEFFSLFFDRPFKDNEIKRFPGLQGCDSFYGYFRTKPDISYAGINLKISHPVYCPDEGTLKQARLMKAEYLGKPYHDGDLVFFLIESNAVYLHGSYDWRFGYFTGNEAFEGKIEILNDQDKALLMTKGRFTSHQR